jgi:hypothetical protein
MGMVELALIGKLKSTKADKNKVLQLDNTTPYAPSTDYNPATKIWVEDLVNQVLGTPGIQFISSDMYPDPSTPVGAIWYKPSTGHLLILVDSNNTWVDFFGAASSGVQYISSSTIPDPSTQAGTIWFNQTNGITYILQIDSAGTTAWVEIGGGGSAAINVPVLTESLITVTNSSVFTYSFTYQPNFIMVYLNRLKLRPSEFTASDGTSITLNIDLEIGDELEFVSVEGV